MMPQNQTKKDKEPSRGQALVELALVLMLLVLIAFGVLDLGRAFHAAITISNAARVGARYGTFHPTDSATTITVTRMEAQNSGLRLTDANSTVSVICPAGCTTGNPIRVRVTYDLQLTMGFVLPNPVTIIRSVEMMIP